MKDLFASILRGIGMEWVIRTMMVSALEAVRDVILETETEWDDRIALKVVERLIVVLQDGPTEAPKA